MLYVYPFPTPLVSLSRTDSFRVERAMDGVLRCFVFSFDCQPLFIPSMFDAMRAVPPYLIAREREN